MTDDKRPSDAGDEPAAPARENPKKASPKGDSPKHQGDKYSIAVADRDGAEPPADNAGAPGHDSPKRHGDKLETARDAAAGRDKDT